MRKLIWVLDLNYQIREGKPEIWIWVIDDQENRMLIIERNFLAYFYLVLKDGQKPEAVIEEISSRKSEFASIVRLEPVGRTYFGKRVTAVKVYCQDPDLTVKYAKTMSKIAGVKESLEDDIRYAMRYLIDNDVSPCGWHEIEVERLDNVINAQVDGVYLARSPPRIVEKAELPKIKILGFSFIACSSKGAPKPDRDPIVILSASTNTGEETQFTAKGVNDKQVLVAFTEYVRKLDPDFIVGYGTNRQDWPYLMARAKKLGVDLKADRADAEPHVSVYGHISLTGRANVDLFDFSDELQEVKVKTLENVADFLGVLKLEKRTLIEDADFARYWQTAEKRPTLMQFSKENTQLIMGIAGSMLGFAIQLSSLVGLPVDHVGTAAVGFRTEWFLMREAYRIGELIPKRVERPYFPYAGAVVLAPKPGLHDDIAVLDFKAMYPNIMITYNVSPDTYVPGSEPEPKGGVNAAPEVMHRFRKEPPGFYKKALLGLIASRDKIRLKLDELDPKSSERKVLDARQKALKVITNAAYGYAGWIGARWYAKPVAEAATSWGRHIILNTVEVAKKSGLEVIYSDTDSVFVNNDTAKIDKLSGKIREELGLEIKPDKVYTRVLFTEAKKKYCGLLPDGRLDIVGLEVVRGDWAACAKNVQEKVLAIILKKQAPDEAAGFVRQYVHDLKQKKVPVRDLIIWKTLTKKVGEYEVKAPHVEAAKLLLAEGWELSMGDKVGYVITVGEGKLYQKAKPYFLTTYADVDVDYYVANQVLPAALRVLEMFGVKAEQLLPQTLNGALQ